MPAKDKTGPEGKGPRTGRGRGACDTRWGKPSEARPDTRCRRNRTRGGCRSRQ